MFISQMHRLRKVERLVYVMNCKECGSDHSLFESSNQPALACTDCVKPQLSAKKIQPVYTPIT
jgi:hypothetical protein